jgi:hypothetical protein
LALLKECYIEGCCNNGGLFDEKGSRPPQSRYREHFVYFLPNESWSVDRKKKPL